MGRQPPAPEPVDVLVSREPRDVRVGPSVNGPTLALPEHGPLIGQTRLGNPLRAPLTFGAAFAAGWCLSLFERGVAALPFVDTMALTLATAATATVTLTELHRTRWSRAFSRRRLRRSLRHAAPGERVRVRGLVEAAPGAVGGGSTGDAVLARYQGRITPLSSGPLVGSGRALEELRGRPFRLVLSEGETVAVDVESIVFLPGGPDEGPDPSGQGRPLSTRLAEDAERACECAVLVYSEHLIRPGDEIEVVGIVEHAVDPRAEGLGHRGARLGTTLRGSARRPLLIRPVAALHPAHLAPHVSGT